MQEQNGKAPRHRRVRAKNIGGIPDSCNEDGFSVPVFSCSVSAEASTLVGGVFARFKF
jgi:hypothetical protein